MVVLLTVLRALLAVALLWQVLGLFITALAAAHGAQMNPGVLMLVAIKMAVAAALIGAIVWLGRAKRMRTQRMSEDQVPQPLSQK